MTLYRYVKKIPAPKKTKNSGRFNPKIMSLLLVFLGILFLANAVYPIVSYQLLVSPRFSTSFVSPASEAVIAQSFGGGTLSSEVLG